LSAKVIFQNEGNVLEFAATPSSSIGNAGRVVVITAHDDVNPNMFRIISELPCYEMELPDCGMVSMVAHNSANAMGGEEFPRRVPSTSDAEGLAKDQRLIRSIDGSTALSTPRCL
jgi:hypothetical protein